jgi:hypothetical protein
VYKQDVARFAYYGIETCAVIKESEKMDRVTYAVIRSVFVDILVGI